MNTDEMKDTRAESTMPDQDNADKGYIAEEHSGLPRADISAGAEVMEDASDVLRAPAGRESKEDDGEEGVYLAYRHNHTHHEDPGGYAGKKDEENADRQHSAVRRRESAHHTHSSARHHDKNEQGDKYLYYDAQGRPHRHFAQGRVRQKMNSAKYDREHGHGEKKKRPVWQRVLITAALVVAALVLALVIAWRILDARGRTALYASAESEEPSLTLDDTQIAQDAGSVSTEQIQEEEEITSEGWQPGWVRYNGGAYEYNSDILTFLFLGIDKEGTVAPAENALYGGQADAQFLLILNPDTKKISLFAINRNAMTDVRVYDENDSYIGTYRLQICLAHAYGDGMQESCERAEAAVSKMMHDLPIHGYCAINMGGIAPLVDAVGGVTVPRMTYADGQITTGEDETLNGEEAYRYLRQRGDDFGAASYRLEKQKAFLQSFVAKVKSEVAGNPAVVLTLWNTIAQYMVTDIGTSEVTYLADQIGEYTFDTTIYGLQGELVSGGTGHEEFNYDDAALQETMIQLFYRKVR